VKGAEKMRKNKIFTLTFATLLGAALAGSPAWAKGKGNGNGYAGGNGAVTKEQTQERQKDCIRLETRTRLRQCTAECIRSGPLEEPLTKRERERARIRAHVAAQEKAGK